MKASYKSPAEVGNPGNHTTYDHDDQDVKMVAFRSRASFADDANGGRYLGAVREMKLEWIIKATGSTVAARQDSLKAKMALAEAVYDASRADDDADVLGIQGGELIITHDDGTTPSQHAFMAAAGSGGTGTRVVNFEWGEGAGAEYATHRTAMVTLTHGSIFDPLSGSASSNASDGIGLAGYDWTDDSFGGSGSTWPSATTPQLTGFTEEYTVSGGGPRNEIVELPAGAPYAYQRAQRSVRDEVHTISYESINNYFTLPSSSAIFASGFGVEDPPKYRNRRQRGDPPKYSGSVTFRRRS